MREIRNFPKKAEIPVLSKYSRRPEVKAKLELRLQADASPGKNDRLDFLLRTLCISALPSGDIHYQLFHRTASAIITAEQYRAVAAIVLVHSFSEQRTGWQDYAAFVRLFGVEAVPNVVQRITSATSVPLFAAWVTGDCSFLKS